MSAPEIRRIFKAVPGYDCFPGCAHGSPDCRPGAGGFHGISGLRLFIAVAVPGRGAASLELHTPLYPRTVIDRGGVNFEYRPLGCVDIHYPAETAPEYLREFGGEGRDCDLVEGKCLVDFSALAADEGYDILLKEGEKGVWVWLAEMWLPQALGARER